MGDSTFSSISFGALGEAMSVAASKASRLHLEATKPQRPGSALEEGHSRQEWAWLGRQLTLRGHSALTV